MIYNSRRQQWLVVAGACCPVLFITLVTSLEKEREREREREAKSVVVAAVAAVAAVVVVVAAVAAVVAAVVVVVVAVASETMRHQVSQNGRNEKKKFRDLSRKKPDLHNK